MLRTKIVTARSVATPTALALTGAALISQGCSVGGTGSSAFIVRRSHVSVAASTPVVVAGKYMAFLADEATTGAGGTDMNGDGDKIDSIAVVINMSGAVETNLDVAATSMAWAGSELFLVVDDALDGRDWNSNGNMTDTVLLHISATGLTATPPLPANFDVIDKLAPNATKVVSFGTNVFYSSARPPVNPTDSNLFVITSAAPTTATMVPTTD